jgi:dihydrolipoamide dehydrogenase
MQVGDSPIFFAGDVTAFRPLLHEAADEGRIAGRNAARYPEVQGQVRRAPLAIVFTDPQIAVVGEHYESLRDRDIVVGEVSYDDQGRARVMGKNRGVVRVYADKRDGMLLGAEMLGPAVEHTAHLLAWSIDARLSLERILAMPFYHPVVEEGIRSAIRDAAAKLRLVAKPCPNEMDCGPGT